MDKRTKCIGVLTLLRSVMNYLFSTMDYRGSTLDLSSWFVCTNVGSLKKYVELSKALSKLSHYSENRNVDTNLNLLGKLSSLLQCTHLIG